VTQGNSSSVHVHFFNVESEFAHAVDIHGRKGFVDLFSLVLVPHDLFKSALLASNRSTSLTLSPVCSSAIGIAYVGPIPIILGASPATEVVTYLANTGNPNSSAFFLVISNTAAAPSVIWLAFPPVVLPPPHWGNALRILASAAGEESCLMPSSWVTVIRVRVLVVGSLEKPSTGTISEKRPVRWALEAR
jgi:uncharacterized membrane protein